MIILLKTRRGSSARQYDRHAMDGPGQTFGTPDTGLLEITSPSSAVLVVNVLVTQVSMAKM
jgi:hypothetical protein